MKNFLSTLTQNHIFLIFANFATIFAYFESGITEIKHFITRVSTKENSIIIWSFRQKPLTLQAINRCNI